MLISEQYRFVFIHIYKTAGTSIQQALTPYVANYYDKVINRVLKCLDKNAKRFHNYYRPQPFPVHITAEQLVAQIGREEFDSYFSFSVVRNPWDRMVSMYKFILGNRLHPSYGVVKRLGNFDAYVEWKCSHQPMLQTDFVCSKEGELLVDYVGKYENLNADFQFICSRIGIAATLSKFNVSNTRPYQDFYSDESKELVKQYFAPDIEMFDYEFKP